ncbi:MAG TPA: hypothetical protein VE783_07785 [Candidatus Limnocylindrales bacterium]|jgi:hypothetical protein|nr:hypothetical protein [Candidatus Limnocylindrales bacterium]
MRPAVLSISRERVLAPIRNAVLAHAGYAVIPAHSVDSALAVLHKRHVCAIVVGQSISDRECKRLCDEAHRLGVPSVILDPYEQFLREDTEVHINPLDGPELFLDALANLVQRDHRSCVTARPC